MAARINIKRLTNEAIRLRHDVPDESEINEDSSSSKPNEILPIIIASDNQTLPHIDCRQSHLDSLCSSDMDHQHQPSNQLLSIIFQLVLLIFIFLSSLSICIHPLHSYKIHLEHSIYNHLYGFFVLLLAFYILAFYVLSRSDLTMHCRFYDCRKKRRLLNQSYTEPPPPPQTPEQSPFHPLIPSTNETETNKILFNDDESFIERIPSPSPPSSSICQSQVTQNAEIQTLPNGYTCGSKRQTNIASKYYARHRHLLKSGVSNSDTSLPQNDSLPHSTFNIIEQE